ncbi:MAG: hypothetical protein LQ342_003673 [Letrouitia transgressa]|nr:MAG: hypothetical protein LQ342_003673 [Letrouitia transgressa]
MSSNNKNSSPSSSPSLLHGHAAYAAGAAKETLGSYTSASLQSTGAADKQAGVDEMRAAKAAQPERDSDSGNATVGKMEARVGGAVGCGGMVAEGEGRQQERK